MTFKLATHPTPLPPSSTGVSGFIYLVAFQDGAKIGRTINLPERMRVYMSPWCQPISQIYCWPVLNPNQSEFRVLWHLCGKFTSPNSKEYLPYNEMPLDEIVKSISKTLSKKSEIYQIITPPPSDDAFDTYTHDIRFLNDE